MLERVLRDEVEVPELAAVMAPWWDYLREVSGALSAGWGAERDQQRRLRAAVGHAVRFGTWRSLTDEGLTEDQAVALMAELVEGVAAPCRERKVADGGD
jgi:hypothetical protein